MMRLPDAATLAHHLTLRLPELHDTDPIHISGRVTALGATVLRAHLPGVVLGALCQVGEHLQAEVVAVNGNEAILSPFAEPVGIACGCWVTPLGSAHRIAVGAHLLGGVVDGLGNIISAGPAQGVQQWRAVAGQPPNALERPVISEAIPLGIRAIDTLLTCGRGQRIGIFAAAGGGKSTLLGMTMDGGLADVLVLALVGERGREVREFLDHVLSPEARSRTVVVVATSDRPALERYKAAFVATTIAEYWRDQGKRVLLLVDSLTRFARAAREIGLAAGESMAANGYPPSVFANLPRLLERAGPAPIGSITGLYTVLVEGDDMNEPIADEVRSILDGHIVLSRKLAERNHYPAIDVLRSVSRVMPKVASPSLIARAGKLRRLLALQRDVELLVRVGEYQRGHDLETDEALDRHAAITAFLCQDRARAQSLAATEAELAAVLGEK